MHGIIRTSAGFLLAMLSVAAVACAQEQARAAVLKIDDAVAIALKGNRQLAANAFNVDRAQEATAIIRTQRLPQFQTYLLGGSSVRPISFSIPQGALGVYPSTGPVPAETSKITTPQTFTGLLLGQVSEPVTQQWKISLANRSSRLAEDLAKVDFEGHRKDTAHSVRDLYYQIVQTQTDLESAEAAVKYLGALQVETDRKLAEQAALKGDSLMVKAKLSQQRYQLLALRDQLASQKEAFNQLLGRDLDTVFTVEAEPLPAVDEIDLAEARKQAARQRTELRAVELQSKRAELEVRRQRAEYIPDLSLHFSYLSIPNVAFLPQNIMNAGFLLQWQPFDWGEKRHKTAALRDAARQAELTKQDAVEQVRLDVDVKFRGLAEARAMLDAAAVSQEAEREKLRVVTNRYGEKAALLSDVLQQEALAAQADTGYHNAMAAFWKAKASFDQALGKN